MGEAMGAEIGEAVVDGPRKDGITTPCIFAE